MSAVEHQPAPEPKRSGFFNEIRKRVAPTLSDLKTELTRLENQMREGTENLRQEEAALLEKQNSWKKKHPGVINKDILERDSEPSDVARAKLIKLLERYKRLREKVEKMKAAKVVRSSESS